MNRTLVPLAALLSLALLPLATQADEPGKHPYYLHALSDLRAARWMIEHRETDGAQSSDQEEVAIMQIDAALNEIKHAAIDDGKDIHEHPLVDAPNDRPGRLHKALELLRKVHADVAREEDDPTTRGLRSRALQHIDAAIRADQRTIKDVEHGR